jgi:hypothetical protein
LNSDEKEGAQAKLKRMISWLLDRGPNQLVQTWKFSIEICVAALEDLSLFSSAHSSAGILAIAAVEKIDDIHPFDNPAQRRKSVGVQSRVITQVDV